MASEKPHAHAAGTYFAGPGALKQRHKDEAINSRVTELYSTQLNMAKHVNQLFKKQAKQKEPVQDLDESFRFYKNTINQSEENLVKALQENPDYPIGKLQSFTEQAGVKQSLLHFAIIQGWPKVVQYILSKKPDLYQEDSEKHSAWEIAHAFTDSTDADANPDNLLIQNQYERHSKIWDMVFEAVLKDGRSSGQVSPKASSVHGDSVESRRRSGNNSPRAQSVQGTTAKLPDSLDNSTVSPNKLDKPRRTPQQNKAARKNRHRIRKEENAKQAYLEAAAEKLSKQMGNLKLRLDAFRYERDEGAGTEPEQQSNKQSTNLPPDPPKSPTRKDSTPDSTIVPSTPSRESRSDSRTMTRPTTLGTENSSRSRSRSRTEEGLRPASPSKENVGDQRAKAKKNAKKGATQPSQGSQPSSARKSPKSTISSATSNSRQKKGAMNPQARKFLKQRNQTREQLNTTSDLLRDKIYEAGANYDTAMINYNEVNRLLGERDYYLTASEQERTRLHQMIQELKHKVKLLEQKK